MKKLNIQQPKNGISNNLHEIKKIANKIKYPILIRPSYVLGGRAMEIAYDDESLELFSKNAMNVSVNNNILIDEYLENAIAVSYTHLRAHET